MSMSPDNYVGVIKRAEAAKKKVEDIVADNCPVIFPQETINAIDEFSAIEQELKIATKNLKEETKDYEGKKECYQNHLNETREIKGKLLNKSEQIFEHVTNMIDPYKK